MELETWRPVVGLEGLYEVSDWGRVRRCARERLRGNGSPYKVSQRVLAQVAAGHSRKYRGVGLKASTEGPRVESRIHLVHRLVASAFLPNPDNLPEVNHRDLDKWNNHVGNLEWTSGQNNQEHAAKRGRFHGRTNPNARFKLQPEQVDDILARSAAGAKGVDLAAEFGVSPSLIYMINSGRAWANPAEVFAHVA